jgi:hypothetical protein
MPSKRIRLKIGENEIEVEGDSGFIEAQFKKYLHYISGGRIASAVPEGKVKKIEVITSKKTMTPAEYIRLKQPKGGTEILLVLAKYLEEFKSLSDFSKKEINDLADEAKIKDIHAQYFTLAVKQGLLKVLGNRKYSLTLSGEDAVVAMPGTSGK